MSYGILSKLRDEEHLGELPVAKMNLEKRLAKAFKSHLEGAKEGAKSTGFAEFDDGRYFARMVKAEITESGSGRIQVVMHWKFLKGEYKGQEKLSFSGIETEDNLKYLLRDLSLLGYDTDEIDGPDDLKGILKELNKEKPKSKISLKTKGEFQNVYILKDSESVDDDEDGDEDEEDADDEPKKKSSKKKSSDDDDDSDDEDDEEEEEKPKKKAGKKKSDDDDGDDDDGDDDDDDDESSDDDDDDDDDDTPKKSKKKASDDEDDEEEESSDGEDVEVAVGSEITYKFKGKKLKGTVLDIFPKENKVRVETDETKRRISFDNIIDVEVPAKPKKKKSKK